MTTTSDHIETALDQLRLAFDTSETTADQVLCFLTACIVHAAIAIEESDRAFGYADEMDTVAAELRQIDKLMRPSNSDHEFNDSEAAFYSGVAMVCDYLRNRARELDLQGGES